MAEHRDRRAAVPAEQARELLRQVAAIGALLSCGAGAVELLDMRLDRCRRARSARAVRPRGLRPQRAPMRVTSARPSVNVALWPPASGASGDCSRSATRCAHRRPRIPRSPGLAAPSPALRPCATHRSPAGPAACEVHSTAGRHSAAHPGGDLRDIGAPRRAQRALDGVAATCRAFKRSVKPPQRSRARALDELIDRACSLERAPIGLLQAFAVARLQPRLHVAPLRAGAHAPPVSLAATRRAAALERRCGLRLIGVRRRSPRCACASASNVALDLLQIGRVQLRDAGVGAPRDAPRPARALRSAGARRRPALLRSISTPSRSVLSTRSMAATTGSLCCSSV